MSGQDSTDVDMENIYFTYKTSNEACLAITRFKLWHQRMSKVLNIFCLNLLMARLKEEQHLSPEEVVRGVSRGSSSLYPFMGSNGVPQFLSPTALYSRSKISPEPGLYPVHNAFANPSSSCSKSTMKRKIKDAETQSKGRNDKENQSPEMYEVKRRGSLAKIHRKKQSDGKLLSLNALNSLFINANLMFRRLQKVFGW